MKKTKQKNSVHDVLTNLFGMDFRTMAAVRIGAASMILLDLFQRAGDLEAHYSDFGVLPRHALLEQFASPWHLSLHLLGGSWQSQFALFMLAGILAVCLLLGFRTRIVTIASWFLLISVQNRNPIVLNAGDFVLRFVLLWGMFLPWGKYFSVDYYIEGRKPLRKMTPYLSIGTAAFLLQIFGIYYFTVLLKTGDSWRIDGTAVYYAMHLDQFQLYPAKILVQFPTVMKAMTHFTFWAEAIGPPLLFLPWFTSRIRIAVVALFFALHLGFCMHLRIGIFSFICMVGLSGFIPGSFWDWLFAKYSNLKRWQTFKNAHRMWFSDRKPLEIPALFESIRLKQRLPLMSTGLAVFFFLYIFVWNLSVLKDPVTRMPANMKWIAHTLRLDQKWGMFAPYPIKDDGWHVMPGQQFTYHQDKKEIDVWTNKEVSWKKPEWATDLYPTYRWRKYLRRLWLIRYKDHRLFFGKYMCRKWNREHQGRKKLESFQIVYMKEVTTPTGELPPEPVTIWRHWCYKKELG